MPVLLVGETEIPYTVRSSARAQRKRITVTPAGVEVVVPEGTPTDGPDSSDEYVQRRRRWVFDSVRAVEADRNRLLEQRFASGAKLQYRGRWLMLDVRPADVDAVEIACRSKFHVRVPKELVDADLPAALVAPSRHKALVASDRHAALVASDRHRALVASDRHAALVASDRHKAIRTAFDAWLRERARHDLGTFVRRHEKRLGLPRGEYHLTDSRHRWGVCDSDGTVRIHWRLVQAPRVAMEYVVAHEVAHRLERHHEPAFWNLLSRSMPEWPEAKEMLERWEEGHRAV